MISRSSEGFRDPTAEAGFEARSEWLQTVCVTPLGHGDPWFQLDLKLLYVDVKAGASQVTFRGFFLPLGHSPC